MATKVNARSSRKRRTRGKGEQQRRTDKAVAADVRKVEIATEVFARHRRGDSYRTIAAAVGLSPTRCHAIVKKKLGRSVHQLSLAMARRFLGPGSLAAPVRPPSLTRRSSRRVRARAAAV